MSNPLKKQRAVFPIEEYVPEEDNDDMIGETLDVEFEGFEAQDSDFHGIKRLLQQCLRGLDVDYSGIADVVISQNYVGSVIKQICEDEDTSEDSMDNAEDLANQIFGVTTVINLTSRRDEAPISGLRTALVEKCSTYATDSVNQMVRELLGHESKHVGFLLSERLVNLPPQFAVPVFDSLIEEIEDANEKGMPYKFTYVIMVCKLNKLKANKKKARHANLEDIVWSNPEEEIFDKNSIASFEYSLADINTPGGGWEEDAALYVPWRKVILLNSSKLPEILTQVKEAIRVMAE